VILFAAGDVGGARALLPAVRLLERHGGAFAVVAHGHIQSEAPADWPRLNLEEAARRLSLRQAAGLVFATSVTDVAALGLARVAGAAGLPTVHVLDNWSNYRRRLELDGLPLFVPTAYAVMDELAREEALRDGVPSGVLAVTGHPNLAVLKGPWPDAAARGKRLSALGLSPDKPTLAFVSEPASGDGGPDPASPTWRGYGEAEVLRLFCQGLSGLADRLQAIVLPHPREDADAVARVWARVNGGLGGVVVRLPMGREALGLADGVVGMTSLLLYEAWLLGLPAVSLEPGLPADRIRSLAGRPGIVHVRRADAVAQAVRALAEAALSGRGEGQRPELACHAQAPETLLCLIKDIMDAASVPSLERKDLS
jgi:hypothetical protein